MFYEVRVYDPHNHIKKIISTKELSRKHWVSFEKNQKQNVSPQLKKKNFQNN